MIFSLIVTSLSSWIIDSVSLEDFHLAKQKHQITQIEHQLCIQQIQKKKIPVDCYKILTINKDNKLRNYLDEICHNIKFQNIPLKELSIAINSPYLSQTCKEAFYEKEKILKYQMTESPLSILEIFEK